MADKLMNTGNVITGSLVSEIRRCRSVGTSKGQGLPMLIYGSPGVGKSEQVYQALEEGETMIDLRLNSLDSIDLRGLPVIKKDKDRNPTQVEWVRPEFIPWEGKGILFLDEINTAAPSVQNPALQLGASETIGKTGWDGNQLRNMNTLSGMSTEWLTSIGFNEEYFTPYFYPSREEFEANKIQIVFLGWAMRTWGLLENGVIASLNGLSSRNASAFESSDLIGLTSVDEDWVILNQMIKYYKYGFGRATDYVNEWIRKGKITRDEGIELVVKFDGVCSDKYISTFCEFISITKNTFWEIVYSHTDKDLFKVEQGIRPVRKFEVGVDFE